MIGIALMLFMSVSVHAQNITAKVYRQTGTTGKAYGKMHIPQGHKYKVAMFPKSGVTFGVFRAHIDGQNIYLSSVDPYGGIFWIDATECDQNFIVRSSDGSDVIAIPVTAAEDAQMKEKGWFYYDSSDARKNSLKYTATIISNETLRTQTTTKDRPVYVMANPVNYGLAFSYLNHSNTTRYLGAGALYIIGKKGSRVRQMNIVFEDDIETETTGISEVQKADKRLGDAIYTLQGVRVENPVKGKLYIRNGHIYVAE